MSMASNYNSQPLAAEVLVEDGRARLVRSRQELSELFARETV
jgi:diaminopimelate decarboxylase